MFITIKNGQLAKKSTIFHRRTKFCEAFLKILWDEGFISGYKVLIDQNQVEVFLKYTKTGKPIISSIQFISKPSKRIYYSAKQLWKLESNKVFVIVSTSKGLLTITDCKKYKVGGEPFLIIN